MFEVVIEGRAPSLNSSYRVHYGEAGNRQFYKDSKVAVWQDSLAWLVKAARPKDWKPARRVLITIEWYQPRKRDVDAGIKACLDAVATGLGIDDSCFLLSVPVNEVDREHPRSVIRISNEGEA